MLLLAVLLLLSERCGSLPIASSILYPLRASCYNIDFCRGVAADGLCDLECSNAECGFDGGDCDSVNEMGGKVMLVVHATPVEFIFGSHRFLSEISALTRSRVEIARDSQDLLIWEWTPQLGPRRRLFPERITTPPGIKSIQVMLTIKRLDCSAECGESIKESIKLWHKSIQEEKISEWLSDLLIQKEDWNSATNSIILYLLGFLAIAILITIIGVIYFVYKKKRTPVLMDVTPTTVSTTDEKHSSEVKCESRVERGEDAPLHLIICSEIAEDVLVEDLQALIKCDENINTIDRDGRSVLHVSILRRRSPSFLRWLISIGADAAAIDDKGQTVLHAAVIVNCPTTLSTMLDYPFVARLIDNCDYRNMSALKLSTCEGSIELARMLIDCGASIDYTGIKGYDPLLCHRAPIHLAVMNNRLELVELLLENGANANCLDDRGRTALHYAVIYAQLSMVRLIAERGFANLTHHDKDLRTAEELARIAGNIEVVNYLMEQADINNRANNRPYQKNLRLHRSRDFFNVTPSGSTLLSHGAGQHSTRGKSLYSSGSDEGVYSDNPYPEMFPRSKSALTLYYL